MKSALFSLIILIFSLSHGFNGEWKKARHGRMDYSIYLSKTQDIESRPLVISLHGCAQNSEDLQKAGNWENAADEYRAVVVLPQVPEKGVVVGCWDYFGKEHSADSKYHKDLILLIEALLNDQSLNIDPKRVYIAGISSGGGETAVMICLRPDLFAGAGFSAAPAFGTDQNSLKKPNVTAKEAEELCLKHAGKNADLLKKLKVVLITGDKDLVVSPLHTEINLEMFKGLSGSYQEQSIDTKTLPGAKTDGTVFVYSSPQAGKSISHIINKGIGHNWPGGQGGQKLAPFVTGNSVNFPLYLLKFFSENK